MTLRVLPDLYRLNGAQRDQLLTLHEEGLIGSPVLVRRLGLSRRVLCKGPAGESWLIDPNGFAHLTPTR